ncbi:hypothetical protein EYF88_00550 [Paracoccus sediminis]|uniref:Secreted protein n=1 Tax=Paracoccus sediminis TaxID=1214787 RepID=A0ABY1YMC2_9RHOB|nr:hypothetical protein [Paracoccus sediminis]TBN52732.1 hypothetical protein EYF88_00550 [Paracoccus sediminis]
MAMLLLAGATVVRAGAMTHCGDPPASAASHPHDAVAPPPDAQAATTVPCMSHSCCAPNAVRAWEPAQGTVHPARYAVGMGDPRPSRCSGGVYRPPRPSGFAPFARHLQTTA